MKQLKAILFADISGSSALYKSTGNQSAKEMVDFLLDSLTSLVFENNGQIIKNIGDEIMTCFDTCQDCIKTANEMQLKFCSLLQQPDLALSIGVGFGEVITDKNDLFGEAVNDAAHLTHVAKGGQILLTDSVYKELGEATKNNINEFDRVIIKGAMHPSLIYRYFWQNKRDVDSETRIMSVEQIMQELESMVLQITYKQQVIILESNKLPFYFGRDEKKCQLKIEADQVSRQHCQIKFSRGKFVLVDHSSNGCYITASDNVEHYIRREEYPIIGNILLSLGVKAQSGISDIIALSIKPMKDCTIV
ncbi:adenylate/guanylate cyclase domain-containing protein [Colwellia sp. KU-HH00111]|uniref:adenylate/guanylate cyclase domain-containing protein n=1 Tax=Colwellia sp. KU-HH00111 TaxID=3127652 RepID=UPI003365874D